MKTFRKLWNNISHRVKKSTIIPFTKDARIVEAFVLDGVQYYTFDNIFDIPVERAFSAIDIYGEIQQKCTRDYLIAHNAAMTEILQQKRIDVLKIAQLINNLNERLEMIFDADLVYKLASVVYFDSSENPYKYDYKYGLEKMQRFKNADVEAFFLKTPIKTFLPFKDISSQDLEVYMKVGREVNLKHLKFLTDNLSKEKSKDVLSKEYELRGISI